MASSSDRYARHRALLDEKRDELVERHGEGKTVLIIGETIRVMDSYADALAAAVDAGATENYYTEELRLAPQPVMLPSYLLLGQ